MALDTCAGTLASPKSFLQLPDYRRFVACEMGFAYFQDDLPSAKEVYAKHFLNLVSSIPGTDVVVEASKVSGKEVLAIVSRKRVNN